MIRKIMGVYLMYSHFLNTFLITHTKNKHILIYEKNKPFKRNKYYNQ